MGEKEIDEDITGLRAPKRVTGPALALGTNAPPTGFGGGRSKEQLGINVQTSRGKNGSDEKEKDLFGSGHSKLR